MRHLCYSTLFGAATATHSPRHTMLVWSSVKNFVGSKATLVVDTGLGQRNGETVLREVGKVSKNALLYVASTHFHPEHTTGGMAFPADTKFTYPQAQQSDIEEFGQEMLTLFRKRS